MSQPAKIMCFYHGNCADGFGAAWAMRHNMPKADIEFIPCIYGKTVAPDVTGRIVYVLDFSFDRETTLRMITQSETFLLLDHHKSAMEMLDGVDNQVARGSARGIEAHGSRPNTSTFRISDGGRILFDMNRSGAGIAWDYFSKGKKPPKLIAHIEDRDLWKFLLPHTKEISAALFSYPYDFAVWDTLMVTDTERLREDGIAILRKQMKDIGELLLSTTREMVILGHRVPVANMPYTLSSDAAHILLKQYPEAPFTACYQDNSDNRQFSLRSEAGRVDVSEIALQFNFMGRGGGHRNASGFRVPLGWEGDEESVANGEGVLLGGMQS